MATIPQARFVCALNEGRGEDPVKTSARIRADDVGARSLNEGRGEDPVKTSNSLAKSVGVEMFAQRRTGRRPRQNLSKGTYDQAGIAQQRSTKDGEKTPSKPVRRAGHVAQLFRSTKDGEKTPSKPLPKEAAYVRLKRKTLNEGRGEDPVKTFPFARSHCSVSCAQRRTGRRPRQNWRFQQVAS